MQFFFEVLIGGLLSGVMYALVALGFVLIYKASGVFNFAQGAMVFFAALTFVGVDGTGRALRAGPGR
jgi:branched-chain amino acid transport system permease protein